MSYPFALLDDPPPPGYPEYVDLSEAARRTTPRFVDPANLYVSVGAVERRGADWCTAVLGFPFPGLRGLTPVQDHMLKLADEQDIDPPLPGWIVEARAAGQSVEAQREQRRRAARHTDELAWTAVLEQTTVELEVHEGSRPRVRASFTEYLRHAVPQQDVYSGTRTIRTHPAGRALCESQHRSRPLALGGSTTQPATCMRCLHWAPKVRNRPGGVTDE